MPNILSAKKRVRVIKAKTLQNKMIKSALKSQIKAFEVAVKGSDKKLATETFNATAKKIDMAAAKGILHKNNAARKKSQLALKLNKMA